ncbi:MAG: hypothetical protein M3P26_14580 [Gemmatimonadota bacterium]|nr:hypothetical protein [Gemmatimonadota bacterium]
MSGKGKSQNAEAIDWSEIRRRNYVSQLLSSRKWFESANELEAASKLIKPQVVAWWESLLVWQEKKRPVFLEFGYHAVHMMLSGFVIENLCKGALIPTMAFEERHEVETLAKLPKSFQTHKLRTLVRRCELTVSPKEEELLHRLTRAVLWNGRYPIAVAFSDDMDRVTLDDGKHYSGSWLGASDSERSEALIGRLREHLGVPTTYRVIRDANA